MSATQWAEDAAATIMERCDRLAELTSMDGGIERVYLSPEMARAYELVGGWMKDAGLAVSIDPAGNLRGRAEGNQPSLPALVLGSHLDSVPDAGKYDGILGVITALSVAEHLVKSGATASLPFAIEVVGFGDEEGARFGATLLGSYALGGGWNDEWLDLTDANGVTMRQAFTDFGLDPDRVAEAAHSVEDAIGYLEFHIEQGPILEQKDRALSSVSSIAAASRYMVTIHGLSSHIATPYDLRHDALTAAANIIAGVDEISRSAGTRANVGEISAEPGGVNVIAGKATFSLDLRAGTDELRDETFARIWAMADRVCAEYGVTMERTCIHTADSAQCDPFLRSCIEQGIEQAEGKEAFGLISYPGHDGMAVAGLLPIAMLYVRCKGGISHSPLESVREDDVAYGAEAFERAILNVADRLHERAERQPLTADIVLGMGA
ncbi:Zn-dependent hydrolase [Bifidobacterium amazonense]|uniref:Zn-dependent hydrolase n=1 Tax=Bifidobacterium amazonense TaxID=2809027 RepID=A0ABS9VWS5_9BIFI|nr:Zn-dependent hydrolase [Bifidobacterium amazonense]MCH9276569.1 Zn-dependent hydrolase [Bifidobacterium amazonense]